VTAAQRTPDLHPEEPIPEVAIGVKEASTKAPAFRRFEVGREVLSRVLLRANELLDVFLQAHRRNTATKVIVNALEFATDVRDPDAVRALILLVEVEDLVELRTREGCPVSTTGLVKFSRDHEILLTSTGRELIADILGMEGQP
jgi:hypothetical protein